MNSKSFGFWQNSSELFLYFSKNNPIHYQGLAFLLKNKSSLYFARIKSLRKLVFIVAKASGDSWYT
jgi:hypothetical protein